MRSSGTGIPAENGRAEQLQFLRFCAFIMVFLWHGKVWAPAVIPVGNAAAEGVSFFFTLSGLASGYSYFLRQKPYSRREHVRYMWKKLKRIYPLYFCMTFLSLVFSGIPYWIVVKDFQSARPYLIQFAKNVLMLQSWYKGGDYFSFGCVGWFISSIMFLYLLTPWLKALVSQLYKRENGYRNLIVMFVIMIAVTTGYCYVTRNGDQEFWQYVFPPARLGEYFAGMLLGFMIRAGMDRVPDGPGIKIAFTCLEAAALLLWAGSLFLPFAWWKYRIVHWLFPNLFLLGIFALGRGRITDLFRMRLFRRLGDISFESYLLHFNILVLYGTTGVGAAGRWGNLFSLAFCLALTLMLACLIAKPYAGK